MTFSLGSFTSDYVFQLFSRSSPFIRAALDGQLTLIGLDTRGCGFSRYRRILPLTKDTLTAASIPSEDFDTLELQDPLAPDYTTRYQDKFAEDVAAAMQVGS